MSITRHHTITAQPTVAPNALPAVTFDPALHGAPIFDGEMWWRVTATGRWVPWNTRYVTQAAHALPALPTENFWPAYKDATGVHLARGVAGLWCEFVVVDIPDANTYGYIEGGDVYAPASTVNQDTTLFVSDVTPGALVEAAPDNYQAIGTRRKANYTVIRIQQPQGGDSSANLFGVTLPAATVFANALYWLQADDGAFTKGFYFSDGTQRTKVADGP